MAIENGIQDPSVVGVGGLRGVNTGNSRRQEIDNFIINNRPQAISQRHANALNSAPVENVGFVGINDSRQDKKVDSMSDLQNLQNFRGEEQSNMGQIINALAQGVTTAGTTLLNGTVGLVMGGLTAANEGRVSGLWDNDFAKALDSVNKWSEEQFAMHMTDKERESVWNQGFGNFVGNLILKPTGFVAGAALSGGGWAGLTGKAVKGIAAMAGAGKTLNAGANIGKGLAASNKLIKAGNIATKAVGTVTSTAGEAAIEALNNSNEFFEKGSAEISGQWDNLYNNSLTNIYNKMGNSPEMFDSEGNPTELAVQVATKEANSIFNRDGALAKLEEDRKLMGNMDYLLNFPILAASNIWQFGRMYSRGFNANVRANNLIRRGLTGEAAYVANTTSGLQRTGKLASNALTEGSEELSQAVAAKTAERQRASEFNSFYGARVLPFAEQESEGFLKSVFGAAGEVLGNKESYFEFLSGALMGVGGNVRFDSYKDNETGRYKNPIYLETNREAKERDGRAELLAQQMNERAANMQERYQGLTRHLGYEQAKKDALDGNNQFAYENSDHAQFISDVIMFDKAGQLNDLIETIDQYGEINEEDLVDIREKTKNESGTSPFDGMTDEQIKKNIRENADRLKKDVETYTNISRQLETSMGDVFQGAELEEMTYMASQIDNFETRFTELHSKVREQLQPFMGIIVGDNFTTEEEKQEAIDKMNTTLSQSPLDLLHTVESNSEALGSMDRMLVNHSDLLKNSDELVKQYESAIAKAKKNKKKTSGLIAELDMVKKAIAKSPEVIAKLTNLSKDLTDMQGIAIARSNFVYKYNGFLTNPQGLRNALAAQQAIANERSTELKAEGLSEEIAAAETTMQIDEALAKEPNAAIRDNVIEKQIDQGNPVVASYKAEFDFDTELNNKLNDAPSRFTRSVANAIWKIYKKKNPSLDVMSNSNYLMEETAESLGLGEFASEEAFNEGKAYLMHAINTVNGQIDKNSKFDTTIKAPVEKIEVDNSVNVIVEAPEPKPDAQPVGLTNIESLSNEQIILNNKTSEINNDVENKQLTINKQRFYYRPAISHSAPTSFSDEYGGEKRWRNIVDWLESVGAFDYVNDNKLQVGDEIMIGIDSRVDAKVNTGVDESKLADHSKHLIIMYKVNTESGKPQVIGTINEAPWIIDSSIGLKNIVNKLTEAINNNPNEAVTIKPGIKVAQMMVGKVKTTVENKSLNGMPGIENIKLGVVKNGALNTNGALKADEIDLANTLNNREGRVYMLNKTVNGKYRPIPLTTMRLTPENVGLIEQTDLYTKRIKPQIEALIDSTSNESRKTAMFELMKTLYTGNPKGDLFTNIYTNKAGNRGLRIEYAGRTTPEFETGNTLDAKNIILDGRDRTDVIKDVLNALAAFNLPIQVDVQQINKAGYNGWLINSDVLSSNVISATPQDNWFITEYLDNEGNPQSPIASWEPSVAPTFDSPVEESVIAGVKINGKTITSTGDVIDNKGRDITAAIPVDQVKEIEEKAVAQKPEVKARSVARTFSRLSGGKSTPITSRKVSDVLFRDVENISKNNLTTPKKTITFVSLSEGQKTTLELKGISQEEFNNMSQAEKEHSLRCLASF
jgi:predicted house-cleaning noncanonical NTP pyrophosphatase (MazG superfamily)